MRRMRQAWQTRALEFPARSGLSVVLTIACTAAALGCGSSQPAPVSPTPSEEADARQEAAAAKDAQAGEASLNAALAKLSEEAFQNSVAAAQAKSRDCYEKLLQEEPGVEIRVVLQLRFDIAGKISDMKFDSPPTDPAFAKCVQEAWKGVSLPVAKDGDLVVPLHFIPEKPGAAESKFRENQ